MKEYLVISQKDKWFSGRFDAATLTKVLNDHARQGWRVITMATASRETLVSIQDKDELIVLLERDVKPAVTPAPAAAPAAGSNGSGLQRMVQKLAADPAAGGEPDVYRLD